MRVFIALELDQKIRDEVARVQENLIKRMPGGIAYTKPDKMHLTLKFFGDVSDDELSTIESMVQKLPVLKQLILNTTVCGCFPPHRPAKVVWYGVEGAGLAELYKECETASTTIGFPAEERGFHPHITLGRIKERRLNRKVREWCNTVPVNATSAPAEAITLFSSKLTQEGSIYEPLIVRKFSN